MTRQADDAQKALDRVASGEEDTLSGWLAYGAALNEGRDIFPKGDNERFSEWLATNNLSVANDAERAAAMWAAGNPDQFQEAKAAGNARTVRGGGRGSGGGTSGTHRGSAHRACCDPVAMALG